MKTFLFFLVLLPLGLQAQSVYNMQALSGKTILVVVENESIDPDKLYQQHKKAVADSIIAASLDPKNYQNRFALSFATNWWLPHPWLYVSAEGYARKIKASPQAYAYAHIDDHHYMTRDRTLEDPWKANLPGGRYKKYFPTQKRILTLTTQETQIAEVLIGELFYHSQAIFAGSLMRLQHMLDYKIKYPEMKSAFYAGWSLWDTNHLLQSKTLLLHKDSIHFSTQTLIENYPAKVELVDLTTIEEAIITRDPRYLYLVQLTFGLQQNILQCIVDAESGATCATTTGQREYTITARNLGRLYEQSQELQQKKAKDALKQSKNKK